MTKSDFCICGTNREIKTSKTEVNTSTCSFSSKYKNIDLQSYELYETSKNSPLKRCMSDILAKNKLQIKYKKQGCSDLIFGWDTRPTRTQKAGLNVRVDPFSHTTVGNTSRANIT